MPFAIKYEHEHAGTLYLAHDGNVGKRRRVRFDREVSAAVRFVTEAAAWRHLHAVRAYLTREDDDGEVRDYAPATNPDLAVVKI